MSETPLLQRSIDAVYPLSEDKRFVIHRLRLCPACRQYACRVHGTDRQGQPVMRCISCGRIFAVVYEN